MCKLQLDVPVRILHNEICVRSSYIQQLHQLVLHFFGACGCQCQHGTSTKKGLQVTSCGIGRSKFFTPTT